MPKGIYQRTRLDPEARFWPKVSKTGKCWLWTGALNNRGYGIFNSGDRLMSAHRFSFSLTRTVKPGEMVMHKCDVRNCVRGSHLVAGTAQENTDDMMKKGRWRMPSHIAKKVKERNSNG